MTTVCDHCRPIREHAQANAPLTWDKAKALKYVEPTKYGACDCHCHDAHRLMVKNR